MRQNVNAAGAAPTWHRPYPSADARCADVAAAAIGLDGDWQGYRYQVKPCPPGFDALNDTLDDQAYRSLRACPHHPPHAAAAQRQAPRAHRPAA